MKKLTDLCVIKRFESKFDKTDGCWEWKAGKRGGYSCFWYDGMSHVGSRISYIIYIGDLSDDKLICHHCDNPLCVNPEHLFVGTAKDNALDMSKKLRGGKFYKREKIHFIHDDGRTEFITQNDLHKKYGIARTNITKMIKGKRRSAGGWQTIENMRDAFKKKDGSRLYEMALTAL